MFTSFLNIILMTQQNMLSNSNSANADLTLATKSTKWTYPYLYPSTERCARGVLWELIEIPVTDRHKWSKWIELSNIEFVVMFGEYMDDHLSLDLKVDYNNEFHRDFRQAMNHLLHRKNPLDISCDDIQLQHNQWIMFKYSRFEGKDFYKMRIVTAKDK